MKANTYHVLDRHSRAAPDRKAFKCKQVNGKDENQLRSLACHYYSKMRWAERDITELVSALRDAVAEVERLQALAAEMMEPTP